jgi:Zinc dependent phospholipase C
MVRGGGRRDVVCGARQIAALAALLAAGVLGAPRDARAYSALAHEAIVDAAWDASVVPALRSRFALSSDALARARAFAYGGSLIQDIGYYPFSSRFFGNLTHYVRSGEFVQALVRQAADADEYAFALGALAHYVADNTGHPLAVNRAVPVLYPKLRAKFGDEVEYADNPAAHLKTEFGFDVVQVARGKYASDAYHNFIGFEVSKPLMERAFRSTYGLEIRDVFAALDTAIGTFRWTLSTTIPAMTKVAWALKQKDIEALTPGMTHEGFDFQLTRAAYEKEWGTTYGRPGFWHKFFAVLLKIVPRVGPFRPIAFKPPTAETERWFLDSFTVTVERYRALIADAQRGRLQIENRNFDTGRPVKAGDYSLADETYAALVHRLAALQNKGATVPAAMIADIKAFYADANAPIETKKHKGEWNRLRRELETLR